MDLEVNSKIEEEVERFSRILRDKIASKNEELILSSKRIVMEEGGSGCIPQPPKMCYHSEIGVISGEIERKTNKDHAKTQIDMAKVIYLWTPHTITPYSYSRDFIVPVRNKATVQSSLGPCFNIPNDELMKIKDGEISFGFLEIASSLNWYSRPSPPYLSKLDVIVGDNEVANFMKKENPLTKTDRLLEIIKNKEGLRKYREDYENKKRENIQESLMAHFSGIVSLNRELDLIESSVLTARLEIYKLQDGREYGWTNADSVNRYFELENKIRKEQRNIKIILGNKESLELIAKGSIKGTYIGFPAEIPAQQYIAHLRTEMESIDEKLKRINDHLEEAERRG